METHITRRHSRNGECVGIVHSGKQESRRGQRFDHRRRELLRRPPVDQFIAGKLFGDELVERFVPIERLNDVIAVK